MKRAVLLSVAFLGGLSGVVDGATSYYVRLRPPAASGLACKIAFELTHTDSLNQNQLNVLSFTHDGSAAGAEVDGGPAYGDLVEGTYPAPSTTLESQFFENALLAPFTAFGSVVTFRLNLTENAAGQGMPPDELSVFLLGRDGDIPYPTGDGLGADALFTIDITGQSGGELSVFAPMSFVAPDTISLDGNLLAVATDGGRPGARLRGTVLPNPATGATHFVCEVPAPGGQLTINIFDVAGRLLARPFTGHRAAGTWRLKWDAKDLRGTPVPAGVYIVQFQMDRESLIRRLVLAR